ncbi:hypothetical protein ABT234_36450 [Streptomyces sp. NPDC001586]|uniref:hypothetical protein n=1 Tax=Streptomyces sp. NPDC001586 TaxID=3154387 RepID=UPI003328F171
MDDLWASIGLHPDQVVRCEVTGHRGRFGVEVSIVKPRSDVAAFVDFVLLTDERRHLASDEFPPIGSLLDAVTLDIHPNGELRLCARPSSLAGLRVQDGRQM